MALAVSLSLIVFGCPSLSCCNWLSFMSLVVIVCPWLNMVVLLFLVVLCLWLSLVFLSTLVVFDVYGCLWLYLFVLSCICLSSVVFVCPWLSSLVCESFVIMLSGRVGRRADANIGFVAFTAKAELNFRPTSNLVKILLYEGCFFKLSAGKT